MPGQRQPGSWGLEPQPAPIDQGTSCLISTPAPRSVGLDGTPGIGFGRTSSPRGALPMVAHAAVETVEDLSKAVSDFQRSETWSSLQPVAFRLLGQYSFGLGVVYGIGENIVTSVVELLQLAKTFLLADLYDRVQQPVFSAASLNPIALLQRAIAEVSMRAFRGELEEAHRERQALIEELRYAMTNIGEVLGNIKEGYVAKWNRFETLVRERRFSSQFEAGRIFGEVLLEVVGLIGGGVLAAKAAAKIPRLAKLARLRIPAKSTAGALGAAESAAAREAPMTPSQLRAPRSAEPVAPRAPVKSATELQLDDLYGKAPAAKVEIDALADQIAQQTGGKVSKVPLKSRERALEKAINDYRGDASRIKDLARNTIVVDQKEYSNAVALLKEQGAAVNEISSASNPMGYSGANTVIKTKAGIPAEIQVNTPEMIYAKEQPAIAKAILGDEQYAALAERTGVPGGRGHQFYEEYRQLPPGDPRIEQLEQQSRAYYDLVRKGAAGQ